MDRFDYGAMCCRIADVRNAATTEDVFNGTNWYPFGTSLATHVGELAGFDSHVARLTGAGIIAALSPMTSWGLNVINAIKCASGEPFGALALSKERAEAIRRGKPFAKVLTPRTKTMNFAHNLSGNLWPVTIDRWALRVAGVKGVSMTPKQYDLVADAYRAVAEAYDEMPATTQAITWCTIRGSHE
jgi:hypothetical protein